MIRMCGDSPTLRVYEKLRLHSRLSVLLGSPFLPRTHLKDSHVILSRKVIGEDRRMSLLRVYFIYVLHLQRTLTDHSSCKYDEFEVEDVFHNVSCTKCPSCPPGTGLTPQCGSFVSYGVGIRCAPCDLGLSYSPSYDIGSCEPCGICSDHGNIKRNCSLTLNSQCEHGCSKGFYYEKLTGDCKACSFCCLFLPHSDESNLVKDGCKDMPFYKQCDANIIRCKAPKCRDDQYLVVTREKASAHCVDCKSCPAGTSLSPQCGSIVESINDVKCIKCSLGETFSDKPGKQPCKVCSTCSVGQKELIPCNLTHDRLCKCDEGFYGNGTKCNPCSACCNDEQDVRIPECVKQNLPRKKQCGYNARSITVCQEQHSNETIVKQKSKTPTVLLIVMTGGIFIVFLGVVFITGFKYRKNKWLPTSQSYAVLLPSMEEAPQSHLETLENPTAHAAQETLSFDKSGVIVQFDDAHSFFNDAQRIRLEICWDVNFILTVKHGEVQLSPVIKFHPYGVKLSKPAKVRIPHSALVFYSNGWNIKLKSSTLHKDSIVWKYEGLYEVHNNEVSFEVDSLHSYVIVGTSLVNNKPTKKRLQTAVFGGEGTVGEDYIAYLYVFDDCEASLEKIIREEKSCGRTLLGSPQSLYVETVISTDIKISVKQPVEGWIVGEIKPEFVTHKSLKESYQTIPRATILFYHDNGQNRDFLCIFELGAGNTSTTICAVASIKEDPFRSHRLETGRNLCDPLILSQEQPSPCLHKLPKEVLHRVCTKLDMPLKGVGNWRHVATSLGFTDEQIQLFRNEMLAPDGSPCAVMLEALKVKSPQLTVAEFVQILQTRKIQRFDAVDVLEAYLYDPVPNSNGE